MQESKERDGKMEKLTEKKQTKTCKGCNFVDEAQKAAVKMKAAATDNFETFAKQIEKFQENHKKVEVLY